MSKRTLGDRIHGRDYKGDPKTPEELARDRHRESILDQEFITPDQVLEAIDPSKLARHARVGWLYDFSLFFERYRMTSVWIVAAIGGANWRKIIEVLEVITGVQP